MIVYLVITGFIGAFKAYSDAVALFGTDLNAAGMNTIVGYVYDMLYGDSGGYPSYASAAAIIPVRHCADHHLHQPACHPQAGHGLKEGAPVERKPTWQKKEKAIQRKNGLLTALTYLLLSIWAVVVLFPFYWMVLTSFKSYGAYNGERTPVFFTLSPTLENYENAFTAVPLLGYLLNTLIFSVITTAAMVVVSTLAAYAFARLKFRGKNLVFGLFLSMMMIPTELVVITNFVTITNWDMRNSFLGLILPSITSVFYIYLLKENFEQVPEELYKAAKVDGTSDLKYLWKVMIPICKPTLVTITILKLIECWNSYVWPRLITDDPAYYLVSNGIQEIRENGFGRENIPAMMAAVVVISVPLFLLFLAFRKKIMEGVSQGGTKG